MKKRWTISIIIAILLLSFITVSAYSTQIGDIIGKVFFTDIVTVIDGKIIPSVNIGGRTAIIVEDLSDYGYNVTWNAEKRTLDVKTKDQGNPNTVSTITGMILLPEGQVAPKGGIEIEIGAMMSNENIPEGASGIPGIYTTYTKTVIYEGNNFATYSILLPMDPKDYQLEFEAKYNQKRLVDHISIKDGKKSNVNYILDMDL